MSDAGPEHVAEPTQLTLAPPGSRWGLGDAAAGFFGGYAVATLFGGIWVAVTGSSRITWGLTVLSAVGLWIGMVGMSVAASRRKGTGDLGRDLGWAIEPRTDIPVGIGAALVAQILVLPVVARLFELLDPTVQVSQESQKLAESLGGYRLVVLILVFTVGAPLVEELFFRGLLLRSLDKRFGPVVAAIGSSIIFGLAHLEGGSVLSVFMVVFSLTLFGLVLSGLTLRYRRLGPGLVAHVTFNLVASLALLLR